MPRPAAMILPLPLTEERFAERSEEVVVHRFERQSVRIHAQEHLPRQQLLTRILVALNARGTGRMSFPALMPVDTPSNLHVVITERHAPIVSLVPCLFDLRRVARPPTSTWIVVMLPPTCRLEDIQNALQAQCPPVLPSSAVYVNYEAASSRPIGIHRHTVVTILGVYPIEGLDFVTHEGLFMPMALRGSDVAVTRAGLSQFLAFPALPLRSTSTTTTAVHSFGVAEEDASLNTFTMMDSCSGVTILTVGAATSSDALIQQALSCTRLPGNPIARFLVAEIVHLPSPQIVVCGDYGAQCRRAVCFDLSPFGGTTRVVDVAEHFSAVDALSSVGPANMSLDAVALVQNALCVCIINHVIGNAFVPLGPHADVVHFYILTPLPATLPTTQPAAATGETHGPAAAASDDAHALQPPTPHQGATSSSMPGAETAECRDCPKGHSARHSSGAVVRLHPGEGRYSVIGTLEGAINRPRRPE